MPESAPIRVGLVSEHLMLTEALQAAIHSGTSDTYVVGRALDVPRAMERFVGKAGRVDVLILPASGISVQPTGTIIEELRSVFPDTGVLVMAARAESAAITAAFRAGARGYVVSTSPISVLFEAMRSVANGEGYLDPHAARVLGERTRANPIADLSVREREVLELIALGYTSVEIGERLSIGVRTVETHRARVARKLSARTRADLVRHALDSGLVEPERQNRAVDPVGSVRSGSEPRPSKK